MSFIREPVFDEGVQTVSKHPQLQLILQEIKGKENKPFNSSVVCDPHPDISQTPTTLPSAHPSWWAPCAAPLLQGGFIPNTTLQE